jgi:glycosidase
VGANGPGQLQALRDPPTFSSLASQRIYFVMTDRYANGDTSNDDAGRAGPRATTGFDPTDTGYYHGGDLKGLAANLQRIKDLGFTALWVTPVMRQQWVNGSSASYHGYWGLDFTSVDQHLGSDADFGALVDKAHSLGLKVYLDVVVNHTGDIVRLEGTSYSDVPYRDCHGKKFNPARFVSRTFPCLKAATMPHVPFVLPGDRKAKQPAWLNDPLNYHDRGDIDFGSCSEACFEQGDFFGLDDLFTEKPVVWKGLAQVYGDWIRRFHVDGFRVDTARHVNAAFFKLWTPRIMAAARAAGVKDFQIFGEVFLNDAVDVAPFVRDRGLPNALDFPFQDAATNFASGQSGARTLQHRLDDDDYFRTASGVEPVQPTFLGNHDMGRAAYELKTKALGASPAELLKRVLLGYDLMYLLRGAPVVYYGDEVGMIGSGGDKAAREDMFPTAVTQWQTEERVGSPPIGKGSSFDVTSNPIETRLKSLAALRDAHPELATGASIVRYAEENLLVVSRVDLKTGDELVAAFNTATTAARTTIKGLRPGKVLFGSGSVSGSTIDVPAVSSLVWDSGPVAQASAAQPKLSAGPDQLTDYVVLTATTKLAAPVSVAFALKRTNGTWARIAVDDSPPYRAFLEPSRYAKGRRLQAIAVLRTLDGKVAASKILTFKPHS